MNMPRQIALPSYQRGLGLVEIMISLVIGLIVLGSLTYLLIGGKQTSKSQDDLAHMQENGRYALDILGKAVRQAGYRLDISKPLDGKPLEGTDGKGAGVTAQPDTITLRRDPTWVKDAHNTLKGEEANCAGGIITSDNELHPQTGMRVANSKLIVSTFSIEKGELRCDTIAPNGKSTSAKLVDQIENMQVEYGMDLEGNGNITSYETADKVGDFSRVAAVRVSLLVKGTAPSTTAGQAQTYTFNGETIKASDGFLRRVYTATFALRNPIR